MIIKLMDQYLLRHKQKSFCLLKKEPLVAQVPVGAIDSTQGLVEQEYEMILPSIEGFWNEISGEG